MHLDQKYSVKLKIRMAAKAVPPAHLNYFKSFLNYAMPGRRP
jgi:hypothetical protein